MHFPPLETGDVSRPSAPPVFYSKLPAPAARTTYSVYAGHYKNTRIHSVNRPRTRNAQDCRAGTKRPMTSMAAYYAAFHLNCVSSINQDLINNQLPRPLSLLTPRSPPNSTVKRSSPPQRSHTLLGPKGPAVHRSRANFCLFCGSPRILSPFQSAIPASALRCLGQYPILKRIHNDL